MTGQTNCAWSCRRATGRSVQEACPPGIALSVAPVALEDLHHVLVHAVAEGRAPDVALMDSVWVREFASSGFLLPLDEAEVGGQGRPR